VTTSSEVDLPPDLPSGSHRAPSPSPGSRLAALRDRRLLQPAIVVLGILLLAVAYIAQARTIATTSEGAGQALQGWDMLHGNLLLRGWSLSDVSFYTTELPEYALVELIRGLNGNTVPLAAAISYFLQVVLAGFLAKGRATGREGWVRALIAVGIMLAPPLGAPTALLMSAPDHTGTHVPLLLIYLVLDRVRPRWWVPILITVMLIWAQVADGLVLVEGVLPIAAVCAVRMYRRRGPWAEQWYDLSLVVGAVLSAGVARVILRAIAQSGGFYVRTPIAAFGTPVQISALFWTKIENVLLVFGADFFGHVFGRTVAVALIHMVAVVLVVWALAHVIRRFYVEDDQIVQMLAVAFVVVFAAYVLGTKPDSNEIVGLLPIGAVLAGRVLGPKIISLNLVPALAVVFVACSFLLLHNATTPAQHNPNVRVASWLQAHHLNYGLAGFWNASSITVETAGNVKVRPVRTYQDTVVAANFETDSTWYDPTAHYANFVVWTRKAFCGDLCLTKKGLQGAFGTPASVHHIGRFTVLVYNKNLLASVPYVSFCGQAWPWVAKGTPTSNLHCTPGG
jgi:hypothetical protein